MLQNKNAQTRRVFPTLKGQRQMFFRATDRRLRQTFALCQLHQFDANIQRPHFA